jgi:hypothetical protein
MPAINPVIYARSPAALFGVLRHRSGLASHGSPSEMILWLSQSNDHAAATGLDVDRRVVPARALEERLVHGYLIALASPNAAGRFG